MKITYENATKDITLENAIWMYERLEICTIISDGRHVTFKLEEPIRQQAK